MFRKITGIVLLAALYHQNVVAQDFSANIGYNSEYIYRGIPQKSSSAFAGADFEAAGYGNTLSIDGKDLLDYGIALIHSNDVLLGGASDTNINFMLSKTFSF